MTKPQYNYQHQQTRAQLAPYVALGYTKCARCGQYIQPGQAWHLDHADDKRHYLGPSHEQCNTRAGAHKRNGHHPPTTHID